MLAPGHVKRRYWPAAHCWFRRRLWLWWHRGVDGCYTGCYWCRCRWWWIAFFGEHTITWYCDTNDPPPPPPHTHTHTHTHRQTLTHHHHTHMHTHYSPAPVIIIVVVVVVVVIVLTTTTTSISPSMCTANTVFPQAYSAPPPHISPCLTPLCPCYTLNKFYLFR